MRYGEFFKLLSQTSRTWDRRRDGTGLRCLSESPEQSGTYDCPITAVFNMKFKNVFKPISVADPERAGYIVGLNTRQINLIVLAADSDDYSVFDLLDRMNADQMSLLDRLKFSWVRYRVRKACGL